MILYIHFAMLCYAMLYFVMFPYAKLLCTALHEVMLCSAVHTILYVSAIPLDLLDMDTWMQLASAVT